MAKRNGSQGSALDPALSQKKRARRRLIGAAALALLAAIVLPLVLDPEPRQAPGEVQVEIPSRDTPVASLSAPSQQANGTGSPGQPVPPSLAAEDRSAGQGGTASRTVVPVQVPPLPAPAADATPPAEPRPAESRPAEPPRAALPSKAPAEPSRPDRGVPVRPPAADAAKQTGTAPTPVPAQPTERRADDAAGRYVIQIGAYANADSARTMAERARKAGVRAYTEPVNTSGGVRTRVRVGPYVDREAAERARGRLTLVGIESTVVTLP